MESKYFLKKGKALKIPKTCKLSECFTIVSYHVEGILSAIKNKKQANKTKKNPQTTALKKLLSVYSKTTGIATFYNLECKSNMKIVRFFFSVNHKWMLRRGIRTIKTHYIQY